MKSKEEMEKYILSFFRTDKICPQCEGPVEVNKTGVCNLCRLKADIRVYTEMMEDSILSIRHKIRERSR